MYGNGTDFRSRRLSSMVLQLAEGHVIGQVSSHWSATAGRGSSDRPGELSLVGFHRTDIMLLDESHVIGH